MWADRLRKANLAARSFGRRSRRARPSSRRPCIVDAHLFLCCGHGWRDACNNEHRAATPWQAKPSSRCLAWQELGPDPESTSDIERMINSRTAPCTLHKATKRPTGRGARTTPHQKHLHKCFGYLKASLKPFPFSTSPSPFPKPFQVDSLPTHPHYLPHHHY